MDKRKDGSKKPVPTDRAPLATKWNVRYGRSADADRFNVSGGATDSGDSSDLGDSGARVHSKPTVSAATVLQENLSLLPVQGKALDLAAGRGGNARLLNQYGLQVHAWDISDVAMQQLHDAEPNITVQVRDIIAEPPGPQSFDVICVSRFLHRNLCASIESALTINGLLFYQTFTKGLSNPDFLLRPNELLTLFPSLHVVHYKERVADSEITHVEAQLIAQRLA